MLGQGNEWFTQILGTDLENARRLLGAGILGPGPPMRMLEMLGAPGDLTIWDPHVIHSSSGNVRSRPRSVIRFRLDRRRKKEIPAMSSRVVLNRKIRPVIV